MKNQFHQDDIYGEMTFLRTLEKYGFDVSIRQTGIDFANIQNALCHANKAGRDNLKGGTAQLIKMPGGENVVVYLKTNIWSEASRDVVVYLGSDDGIKVWLNGQLVHQNNLQRGCTAGEDSFPVKLKKGWNICLLKVTQGTGGWEAAMAICDVKGNPVGGLKYKAQ